MSRKHSARKRRPIGRDRVGDAVAIARMRKHLTTVRIGIYLADAGPVDRDLLSSLGWVIGMGAEIAATVAPGEPAARRLHAALRTLVQMSVDDDWNPGQAAVMEAAAQEAHELLIQHAAVGLPLVPSADWLGASIRDGTLRLSHIAGAEIYSPAAQPAGTSQLSFTN